MTRGRFQTDLPDNEPPQPPPPRGSSDFSLGPIAEVILYGLLGIAAIFILYTLMQKKIAPTRPGAKARGAAREVETDQPRAPSAAELADAEAAAIAEAQAGRFEEAIHILLLGAIGRLRERDARSAARSLTSREILSRAFGGQQDAPTGEALRDLVAAVEISRFGGRSVNRTAFDRCLDAYRALRRATGGASVPHTKPALTPA